VYWLEGSWWRHGLSWKFRWAFLIDRRPSVNFHMFSLPLQICWANFNQSTFNKLFVGIWKITHVFLLGDNYLNTHLFTVFQAFIKHNGRLNNLYIYDLFFEFLFHHQYYISNVVLFICIWERTIQALRTCLKSRCKLITITYVQRKPILW
jgi:hypothetical protein